MRGTVAVAFTLLLAGCSGDPSTPDTTTDFEGIALDANEGAIRGVVVDASIQPLVGALVALEGHEPQLTNDKGAFVFAGMEPGYYVLSITMAGYFPGTAGVAVTEQELQPPVVKVVLEPDIATRAYAQTVRVVGYLECGTGLPSGSWSVCQAPVGVVEILCKGAAPVPPTGICLDPVNDHQGVLEVPIERVPTFAQAEAVWDATSSGSNILTWGRYVRHPGTIEFSNGTTTTGASPVVMPWSEDNLTRWDVGGEQIMVYQVFPQSGGVGQVVLEQHVELFVTTFYRFTPPQGWQFSVDGEPAPP